MPTDVHTPPLLEVRDLRVRYHRSGGPPVHALGGVDLTLAAGETLGVLGESGCGKSSLAAAIAGMLPSNGEIASGEIRLRGERIDTLAERDMLRLRGAEIGMVFQDPALALHPMRRVGEQIAEIVRVHRRLPRKVCRERALDLLGEMAFEDPAAISRAYPHQLSGGERQRVVLAQAVSCRPALLLADEPTVALDTVTRAQVLDLLNRLKTRHGVATLHISHDPEELSRVADRILVLYAGRSAELGSREQILDAPRHPYTAALLACLPPLPTDDDAPPPEPPTGIPGTAPHLAPPPVGCRFAPRCGYAEHACREDDPAETVLEDGRRVWCRRVERILPCSPPRCTIKP